LWFGVGPVERRHERVMAGHGKISDATLGKLRVLSELSMGRAGESLTGLLGIASA
jgi:hypothetical protein